MPVEPPLMRAGAFWLNELTGCRINKDVDREKMLNRWVAESQLQKALAQDRVGGV